jgi:hypothetical protein
VEYCHLLSNNCHSYQVSLSDVDSVDMVERAGCLQLVLQSENKSRIVLRSAVGIREWFDRIKVRYC